MYNKFKIFSIASFCLLFIMCNQKEKLNSDNEVILKGNATLLVDETLTPIIEDQVAVFESNYKAKFKIISKSESEIVNSFLIGKSVIAVLSRKLSDQENKIFEQKKIIPKTTKFATDAIAFISNKSTTDTLIDLKSIVDYLQGINKGKIKGLVFDNPNSSTVRYMNLLAGVKSAPEKGIYSFKTNDEVIKFVSENQGMIGIVGVNWLSQPSLNMVKYVNQVNVYSVKGLEGTNYYYPSQNNIAEGKYPLARDLFIINCQGYSGLGMGFASFVAGDIGQRIVLKSGLLPVTIPGRRLNIRNDINNEKK